jgi:hypothetical protein
MKVVAGLLGKEKMNRICVWYSSEAREKIKKRGGVLSYPEDEDEEHGCIYGSFHSYSFITDR